MWRVHDVCWLTWSDEEVKILEKISELKEHFTTFHFIDFDILLCGK